MAALHLNPIADPITLREAVAFIAETRLPMTQDQLRHMVDASRIPRERYGRGFRYSATDLMDLHYEWVMRGKNANP